MKYLIGLLAGVGAILLYLLSQASANTDAYSHQYALLLGLAGLLMLAMLGTVLWQLAQLRRKLRARLFGSKLTLRLLWMFCLVSLLPGLMVYGVSVQFLKNSIETWFDVKVDYALKGGLNLGRTALDSLQQDLSRKASALALDLADQPQDAQLAMMQRLRAQNGIQEADLFDARGDLIGFSSADPASMQPQMPSADDITQVRQQHTVASLDALPGGDIRIRVLVPVNVLSLNEDIRILQLVQPVPRQLATDAQTVQNGYQNYQELSLARVGIKRIYGLSLTFALLLSLFTAIGLAFLLSERLSEPLSMLAEGTRAVARGNFSRMPVHARDELGALMRSFNSMTRQLSEARETAETNRAQLEAAKTYLEGILSHLSSGVLTFDDRLYLRAANPAAEQILGLDAARRRGLKLTEWAHHTPHLAPFADEVLAHMQAPDGHEWQVQIGNAGPDANQTLLVRGTRLPVAGGGDLVVIIDDITHLIQAQRDAAWGEVARRLAHEIRNPLTPIQLSAERLEHKLAGHLEEADRAILERATRTIVNQVGEMKHMVDAFREYARLPATVPVPVDLSGLVREILGLYETQTGTLHTDLAPVAMLTGDASRLRQVVHNLLRNAQDAVAQREAPEITVRVQAGAETVRLLVEDNGPGFPEHLMTRLFEPYVTTKPKGTGLGLAIVRKIIEEHQGLLHIENRPAGGACVAVELPALKEGQA